MRQLVKGILQFKGDPKPNPFKEGEMQVGLKFTIRDGAEEIEEWVNEKPDAAWHSHLKKGDVFYFVREWSVKKKNKETGQEGAYAYRPIDIGPAFDAEPVNEPEPKQERKTEPKSNGNGADYPAQIKALRKYLHDAKDPERAAGQARANIANYPAKWKKEAEKQIDKYLEWAGVPADPFGSDDDLPFNTVTEAKA